MAVDFGFWSWPRPPSRGRLDATGLATGPQTQAAMDPERCAIAQNTLGKP